MTITSLNIYKTNNRQGYEVSNLYDDLNAFIDNDQSYFKLNLSSNEELFGEYVYVQNIKQSFYDIKERNFQIQVIPKASIVPFYITKNGIMVWANKNNSNKFLFVLNSIIDKSSFQTIDINTEQVIEKIARYKIKISKICIDDIILKEDIIGSFSTDLHDYGESFNILNTYKKQIAKLNFQYYTKETFLTLSVMKNGNIILYKDYKDIDGEQIQFLRELFLG